MPLLRQKHEYGNPTHVKLILSQQAIFKLKQYIGTNGICVLPRCQ